MELNFSDGWERKKDADIGFFLKKNPEGWKIIGNSDGINMKDLRVSAKGEYMSRLELANRIYESDLVRAFETQEFYRNSLETYSTELRNANLRTKYAEALDSRALSVKNLETARTEYEKAAKWQKIAQGWKIMSTVTSMGAQAAGKFSPGSEKDKSTRSFTDQLIDNAKASKNFQFSVIENSYNCLLYTSPSPRDRG